MKKPFSFVWSLNFQELRWIAHAAKFAFGTTVLILAQATIILIGHNLDLMLVLIICVVTNICKTQNQNGLEAWKKKKIAYWILCQIFSRNVLKNSSLLPHSMRTTKEKSLPLCVPNEINSAVKQKRDFFAQGFRYCQSSERNMSGQYSHSKLSLARESTCCVDFAECAATTIGVRFFTFLIRWGTG